LRWAPRARMNAQFKSPSCDFAAGATFKFAHFDDIAMAKTQRNDVRSNQLLGALELASRKRIGPHLEPIKLKLGDLVCEAGGLLKHAYFPQGTVLSLLTVLEDGSAIETANIGREGAFGLFAAMYSRTSFNRCLVQLEGGMVRCPIELLQSEFKRSEHVRDLFVSYSETLLSQVQQTVACNAMHSTEEKICRWLLMMHDRAECYAIVRERFDAFLTPPLTAVQGNTKGRRK
jgi:CRP-like cAMP-binding protein